MRLPQDVQLRTIRSYRLWRNDPTHGSLHFKLVSPNKPYYSVRISDYWRAVGVKREDGIVWFWIGSHADYDQLLKQL